MYVVRALSTKLSDRIVSTLGRKRTDPISWGDIEYLRSTDYPVFPSRQDVPEAVFDNKNLVVEKFLPEVAEGKYCVRYYYFFGDKEVHKVFRSTEKVVKGTDEVQCDEVHLPAEICAIRQQLGMDYGKLDYVLRDGNVVLLDANRTPGYPALNKGQLYRTIARQLADGIWSKLN
jgi:hypothetical protein